MNNKGKTIIIILITIIIGLLGYIMIDKLNLIDKNANSLIKAGYIKQEDGNYKAYINGSEELEKDSEKLPYVLNYAIVKNDYSEISFHSEWRVDNKETYINRWYDYKYNSSSNIAKGDFTEIWKKGDFNIYHASYDFNNGNLICDAPQKECNNYAQDLINLKERYYSLIKK